jgi:hypothetical protein
MYVLADSVHVDPVQPVIVTGVVEGDMVTVMTVPAEIVCAGVIVQEPEEQAERVTMPLLPGQVMTMPSWTVPEVVLEMVRVLDKRPLVPPTMTALPVSVIPLTILLRPLAVTLSLLSLNVIWVSG